MGSLVAARRPAGNEWQGGSFCTNFQNDGSRRAFLAAGTAVSADSDWRLCDKATRIRNCCWTCRRPIHPKAPRRSAWRGTRRRSSISNPLDSRVAREADLTKAIGNLQRWHPPPSIRASSRTWIFCWPPPMIDARVPLALYRQLMFSISICRRAFSAVFKSCFTRE